MKSESLSTKESIEKLPETKFEIAGIQKEAYCLNSLREYWNETFCRFIPELKGIPIEGEDNINKYEQILDKLHEEKKEELTLGKEYLEKNWNEISEEFFKTLSDHFETEWPDGKTITGEVSVLPVYPRNLERWSFFVAYQPDRYPIETCAHEILHFLWFKKWREVFPDINPEEYNQPYLAWRLSEIMDPIILQCHPKIKELIKPTRWGYPSFKNLKVGEQSMIDYFKNIYLRSVEGEDNFETTLRKLWKEAQEHETEIRF